MKNLGGLVLVLSIMAGCVTQQHYSSNVMDSQKGEGRLSATVDNGAKSLFGAGGGVQEPSGELSQAEKTGPGSRSKASTKQYPGASTRATSTQSYQGLSYWIEKEGKNGFQRVTTSARFVSGERIRLHVTANDSGYLYIVNQGSSGRTRFLFPTSADESEYIEPHRSYVIPRSGAIRFDDHSGDEIVWLFLSKKPLLVSKPSPARVKGFNDGRFYIASSDGGKDLSLDNSSCGGKDLTPETLQARCGVRAEERHVQEDMASENPAEYAVTSAALMEKGQILGVRMVLSHN